jgi:hypothetical protein
MKRKALPEGIQRVWLMMSHTDKHPNKPIKSFTDQKLARAACDYHNRCAVRAEYTIVPLNLLTINIEQTRFAKRREL